ncbi:uncharacterized protein LOC134664789 [Cydia fagiglandana]|uniref:uncharacterized protein LOC134664789 n=1 Tax=Cydia fagiglandana TaxID=1458189 RepID=UPI002FEDFD4D
MAPVIFLFALAVLTKLSEAYSLPYLPGNEIEDSWPHDCEGRNYCWIKTDAYRKQQNIFDKVLSGQVMNYRLGEEVSNRDGEGSEVKDIGNCGPSTTELKTIYMIKDEEGTVWYVPQTTNYTIRVQIEECGKKLGPITESEHTGLERFFLKEYQVHCVEQRVEFTFPVLHQNGNKYYIKLMSPAKGLPLSCSAKILKQ